MLDDTYGVEAALVVTASDENVTISGDSGNDSLFPVLLLIVTK